MTQDPWLMVGDVGWAAIVGILVFERYYALAAFLALALLLLRMGAMVK
jgi:hypothetical protein